MKRMLLTTAILCMTVSGLAGCHCSRLRNVTEHCSDTVDHVAANGPHFDKLYVEELDVTRWCRNPNCCYCNR